MGVGSRAALAARLIARGWAARTPAAILLSASTPDAQTWTGTLDALATRADGVTAQPGETPGLLVIGGVVALAGQIGLARNLLNDYAIESGEVLHGSGG
jgi:siroheme synthase